MAEITQTDPLIIHDTPQPPESTIHTPESSLPPENPFDIYLDQRLKNREVFNASNYARNLSQEQRPLYQEKMGKAAKDIISFLGIESDIFTDRRYCEAFFVACDSWVINEENPEGENYKKEKKFLTQFVRILAGEKSEYNHNAVKTGKPDAYHYANAINSADNEKNKQKWVELKDKIDPQKTAHLKEMMEDKTLDSLLANTREFLWSDDNDETPYNVMVVKLSREGEHDRISIKKRSQGTNTTATPIRDSEWTDFMGTNAPAVTKVDPNGVYTIIMSEDVYDNLIGQNQDAFSKDLGKEIICHEWAHTQRQARIGWDAKLGRIWDENIAVQASNKAGFGLENANSSMLFYFLATLLADEPISNMSDTFHNTVTSNDSIPTFYSFFGNRFGLRTSLLFFATQPLPYTRPYGIDEIPEVRMDPNYRAGDLLKIAMEERNKISPTSTEACLTRFNNHSSDEAETALRLARTSRINLPDNILQILETKVPNQ